ncbi:hypothetical protein [Blastococcus litoris]|uniref:hypothetical protein n=1 Tax=Blastococcus litoris TaxID=2171622 RepID=UPI000E303168|nr:hypothetical protein [Blastococcus litoris]
MGGYDLDFLDTAEVRRRVVVPVVSSLVRADELEELVVEVGRNSFPVVGRENWLRVAVKARGEWIEPPRRWLVTEAPEDAQWFADELYDLLRDELAESRLAWGELRDGTFEVLPPGPTG